MDFSSISGMTDYYADSISKTNSTADLTTKVANAQTDEELMEACKEFETYLWEQVLKSMEATVNITGEGSSSQMVDYFMDSAMTDLAGSLTEQSMGPNSLAMQMYEQMTRNQTIDVEALLAQSREANQKENQ
jgi:Rod binding domain-containing protein